MDKLKSDGRKQREKAMKDNHVATISLFALLSVPLFAAPVYPGDSTQSARTRQIISAAEVKGGLIVHLGCGDGKLTTALRMNNSYVVQGLDTDEKKIDRTREHVRSLGLYGKVTARKFDGLSLPYIDNMVNLVVCEDLGRLPLHELMRVLCPGGVALVKKNGKWDKTVKAKPKEIDEWTHYLYDASNNAVSHDSVVGPPRQYQWIGQPKWSRSHEHMSSFNAMVSARGRIFYVIDEGSRASITLPAKWSLIARDGFNGVILWKRSLPSWHTHLWPLKSGPAQIQRRLVANGDAVYLPLGAGAPLSALNAESGKIIRTFENTKGTEEVIACEGVLFLLVGDSVTQQQQYNHEVSHVWDAGGEAKSKYAWDDRKRTIMAIHENAGNVLWKREYPVVTSTMAADSKQVYFHDGSKIIGLDRKNGKEKWVSKPVTVSKNELGTAFTPTLVLYRNVILFSSGEEELTAVGAKDGDILWTSEHPHSGHHSPEDVLCIDGLVWAGAIARIKQQGGKFTGRDLLTGEIKSEFPLDVDINWFHHRCHRSKATDRFILAGGTGTEFVDFRAKHWITHHWARGACLYGIMPANGLLYVPPSPCACFMESKLTGLNALAPASTHTVTDKQSEQFHMPENNRLEKGPAYGRQTSVSASPAVDCWPTYRHDANRSGYTRSSVPTDLEHGWETRLGGKITPPVVADGKVFVASVNDHTVNALDEISGRKLWSYIAAGRIDSPPTIYKGMVLFGSADGWVYCLCAADGELVWRFLAARTDRQLICHGQPESVWPVHGSVLIQNDTAYCVSGRSMFLDGGMRLLRLDPATGRKLSETVLDDRDPETGENLQTRVQGLTMPVALPDILSSDGKNIYMRSQRFDLDGSRTLEKRRGPAEQGGEGAHLFAPSGFLDDTWFHRTYWLFGKTAGSGWGNWMNSARYAPAGRIIAVGDSAVYGFGREPAYLCQSSVIEYHLFSASKQFDREEASRIRPRLREVREKQGDWIADWRVIGANPISKMSSVDFDWRVVGPPLLVRAMVLADKTLFIAGPPDIVDETKAFGRFNEAEVRAKLDRQQASLDGEKGSLLWSVSATDGNRLSRQKLDSLPVFDGMAAAAGRLYLSTTDGNVICFKGI
ncbi:MAG: outer membrane protein assembly factor BamB family protein [Planctomycetota bacterium]|jgi:outer membrane protein assembly factor BamB